MSISAELLADAFNHTSRAFAGLAAALGEVFEREMYGEWYVIAHVATYGGVSWANCHAIHSAEYPIPEDWIIVGKTELDGPYTRRQAEEAFGLLITALERDDA